MSYHSALAIDAATTRNEGPFYMDDLAHRIAMYEANRMVSYKDPWTPEDIAQHRETVTAFWRGAKVIEMLARYNIDAPHNGQSVYRLRQQLLADAGSAYAYADEYGMYNGEDKYRTMQRITEEIRIIDLAMQDGFK
jgi:hypothetical protein